MIGWLEQMSKTKSKKHDTDTDAQAAQEYPGVESTILVFCYKLLVFRVCRSTMYIVDCRFVVGSLHVDMARPHFTIQWKVRVKMRTYRKIQEDLQVDCNQYGKISTIYIYKWEPTWEPTQDQDQSKPRLDEKRRNAYVIFSLGNVYLKVSWIDICFDLLCRTP
jgi:hypothetical protein